MSNLFKKFVELRTMQQIISWWANEDLGGKMLGILISPFIVILFLFLLLLPFAIFGDHTVKLTMITPTDHPEIQCVVSSQDSKVVFCNFPK